MQNPGVVAVLILSLFSVGTKAQSVSLADAFSECSTVAQGAQFGRSEAHSIAQALVNGFQNSAAAQSFCQTISRSGSAQSQASALAFASNAFRSAIGSRPDTDCTYSVAIATCAASAEAGNTLSFSDASAIAESFGNTQAIAICEAMASANGPERSRRLNQARAGAEALIRACGSYGTRNFVSASSDALAQIGLGGSRSESAASALARSGNDLAMSAAKACGRALGLTDAAMESLAQASSSASSLGSSIDGPLLNPRFDGPLLEPSIGGVGGNDLSASSGSSASVQTNNRNNDLRDLIRQRRRRLGRLLSRRLRLGPGHRQRLYIF